MTYFVYEKHMDINIKVKQWCSKQVYEIFVVCLRFALIIITWQINNYFVLNDFIQLLVNVSVFDFFLYRNYFVKAKTIDDETNVVFILTLTKEVYACSFYIK